VTVNVTVPEALPIGVAFVKFLYCPAVLVKVMVSPTVSAGGPGSLVTAVLDKPGSNFSDAW